SRFACRRTPYDFRWPWVKSLCSVEGGAPDCLKAPKGGTPNVVEQPQSLLSSGLCQTNHDINIRRRRIHRQRPFRKSFTTKRVPPGGAAFQKINRATEAKLLI